jgi:hypothetical protein
VGDLGGVGAEEKPRLERFNTYRARGTILM